MSDTVIGPVEQQTKASVAEGKELAKILESDRNGGEQKVRTRLLNDAFDSAHGKFNMETIKKSMIEDLNAQHLPGLELKEDKLGNVYKKGLSIPGTNIELNNVSVFDRSQADAYVAHMDEINGQRPQEQSKKSDAIDTRRVDIFGAVNNLEKLFGQIYEAGKEKKK